MIYPYQQNVNNVRYAQNVNFAGANTFYGNSSQVNPSASTSNSTSFNGGLTEKETKALTDCYVSSPSESVLGSAAGGVVFGVINNPRLIVHPWNSFKATAPTEKMFKAVTEKGSPLNKLWENPETNDLMREAYFRMHKIEARKMGKAGAFRKKLSTKDYDLLKSYMEEALRSGNKEQIAEATAKLQQAYVNDGWLAKPVGKVIDTVKGWFGKEAKPRTVDAALQNTEAINAAKNKLLSKGQQTSMKDFMKKHASASGVVMFALFDFALGLGNIKKAFAKDAENKENGIKTNYGMKQLGQTTIKGLGSGIGWGVGEALANFSFAKWGTKLGTKKLPWAGAGIGGVAGVVGGSLGMMLIGRLTHALVGDDIGEKIEAQELTKTPEGQAKLLETVYQKAQKGEASPEAQAALQKAILQLHA